MPEVVRSGLEWVRPRLDAILAGLFAVAWLTGFDSGGLPHGSRRWLLFVVFGLVMTVPFAIRQTWPIATYLITIGAGVVYGSTELLPVDLPIAFVVVVVWAAYSLGAHGRGRWALIAFGVGLVGVGILNLRNNDAGVAGWFITPGVFLVLPWAIGRLVRRLRAERGALRQMTAQLEREQDELARASVLEERSRIARELHDIVAHSISVMVVQAGAAEQVVPAGSPARAPLAAIRGTGQEALVEMRRLLGVLRTDDAAMTLAPQPGLDNLDGLVDAARQSGLDVTVDVHGEPVPLPPGVDVAAYRLVQESFSNVRKHARARSAAVSLDYRPTCLTVAVVDDGVGQPVAAPGGHGLIGMRERVALFGGRLECGPRGGGGWQVRAELPIAQ